MGGLEVGVRPFRLELWQDLLMVGYLLTAWDVLHRAALVVASEVGAVGTYPRMFGSIGSNGLESGTAYS